MSDTNGVIRADRCPAGSPVRGSKHGGVSVASDKRRGRRRNASRESVGHQTVPAAIVHSVTPLNGDAVSHH